MTMMMTPRITVGIVDDDILLRKGVRGVLESAGEIVVVGETCDGAEAVELARTRRPQVLLMCTAKQGRNGPTAVRRIRSQVPATEVVVLAADRELLLPVLLAGAAGFLLKNGEPEELIKAVRVVAAGGVILCPAATQTLVDHVMSGHTERQHQARHRVGTLTERERQVLAHIAKGMENARIARTLHLSEGSIKAYVSRLLTKLRCDNRVQAALIAHQAALVSGV